MYFQKIFFPACLSNLIICPNSQFKKDSYFSYYHTYLRLCCLHFIARMNFSQYTYRTIYTIYTIGKERAQINIIRNKEFKIMLDILQVWSIMEIYLENYFIIFNIPHNISHSIIGRQNQSFIHQTVAE